MRDWGTRVWKSVSLRIYAKVISYFSPVDNMQFKVYWYTQYPKIIEYSFKYGIPDQYKDDFFFFMLKWKYRNFYL